MRTWVKLYTEINRDPKIGTLTWAQKGIWSALLALAGEIDAEDQSGQRTGALDTVDNIAWRLRCDEAELGEAMDTFAERGMAIEDKDGVWYLPNFANRQARAPSQRRDAVRERVQRHRAKDTVSGNGHVTSLHQAVTPSESESESESESDTEAEAEIGTPIGVEAPKRRAKPTDSRRGSPAIRAIQNVKETKSLPPKGIWDKLITVLGSDPNLPLLRECYAAWCAKGWNVNNYAWALEWYAQGGPPKRNGHNASGVTEPAGMAGIREYERLHGMDTHG